MKFVLRLLIRLVLLVPRLIFRGIFGLLQFLVPALAFAAPDNMLADLSYGALPKQKMDVYLPAPQGEFHNAPILVMIHGGAWITGDKREMRVWKGKLNHYGPRGYILVSINYRLLPKASVDKQARDVARALAYVQRKAPEWGGNPANMVVMGHSAGAHLAALVSADQSLLDAQKVAPWKGTVVLDTAALDLNGQLNVPNASIYLVNAFGDDPKKWQPLDPVSRLRAGQGGTDSYLVICSARRETTSCAASKAFVDKVRETGGRAALRPVPLSHGRINSTLGVNGPHTQEVDSFLRRLGLP